MGHFFTEDREFTKKLVSIGIPIAMQNLINFCVSTMDTLMLGLVGEVQLSAASIAGQLAFMFMILSTGVASGCGVLVAQYWGAGDKAAIKRVLSFMYRVVIALSLVFSLLALFAPEWVMHLFINDGEVVAEGVRYFQIIGYSYLLSGLTNATTGVLRSIGCVNISVVVYSASLVSNTFLNWVFIFGNLGAPAMGVAGAALATLIARVVELGIVGVFLFRVDRRLQLRPVELLHTDGATVRNCIRYAIPVLLNEMMWSSGNALVVMVIGRLGRECVAANSISSVMFQLAGVVVFGVSSAASAITGNTIGTGDYALAKKRAGKLVVIAGMVGLVASGLIFAIRPVLINFYQISDLARQYAFEITAVTGTYAFFSAISMITMMGVLRGGGDTRFVMVADVVFMWCIAIPFGALAGLVWHWPVPVVYGILKCEDLFKSGIAVLRIRSGRWVRDITQA